MSLRVNHLRVLMSQPTDRRDGCPVRQCRAPLLPPPQARPPLARVHVAAAAGGCWSTFFPLDGTVLWTPPAEAPCFHFKPSVACFACQENGIKFSKTQTINLEAKVTFYIS